MILAIDFVKGKFVDLGWDIFPANPEKINFEHVLINFEDGRTQAIFIVPINELLFGIEFVFLFGIAFIGKVEDLDLLNYFNLSEQGKSQKGYWAWMRCNPEIILVGYGIDLPVTASLKTEELKELCFEIAGVADQGEKALTNGQDQF